MKIGKILVAVRPFSFIASFLPVTVGSLLSQRFSPSLYLLSLVASLMIHAGVNTTNDYFDYKSGVDTENSLGSSGLLVKGKANPLEILVMSIICYVTAAILGLILVELIGFGLLWIGLIGIVFGYSYTAPPLQLKYRALGIPVVFILMGPLMALGAYYVQSRTFSMKVLLSSIPIGIATSLILLANEIRDTKHDRDSGIKTLPIVIGEKRSVLLYAILVIVMYSTTVLLFLKSIFNVFVLLAFAALPMYSKVIVLLAAKARGEKTEMEIANVDKMSALAETVLTVPLILGSL